MKYKLSGRIIKEIERLPIADIKAKNLEEAQKKYCEIYAKDKTKEGQSILIKKWSKKELDNSIAKEILKDEPKD